MSRIIYRDITVTQGQSVDVQVQPQPQPRSAQVDARAAGASPIASIKQPVRTARDWFGQRRKVEQAALLVAATTSLGGVRGLVGAVIGFGLGVLWSALFWREWRS